MYWDSIFNANVYLLKIFVVTYSNLQCFSANAWRNNNQENIDIDNRRENFIFLNKALRSYSVGEWVFSGRLAQMV